MGPVVGLLFSIWVFFDARTRKNRSLGWSFLTFISGSFIALTLYFAYRNLKTGEVREGGTVWNIIRNYTLSWTVFIVVFIFASLGISENGEFIAYTIIVWLFITLCNYSLLLVRHLYVEFTLQIGHFVRWARGVRRSSLGEKVSLRFLHRAGVWHPSRQVVAPNRYEGLSGPELQVWRTVLV